MVRNAITIKETLKINADRTEVWNFTQDFSKRSQWDHTVKKALLVQKRPNKRVRLWFLGGIQATLYYKLCRRLERTSLRMENTKSILVSGGGGSWSYKTTPTGTEWTQVNSLVLRNKGLYALLGKFLAHQLRKNTQKAMLRAKTMIERQ